MYDALQKRKQQLAVEEIQRLEQVSGAIQKEDMDVVIGQC